jgi:F0F1-type ATP synthase membrane subunit c/vacuolar-type H+-ATPase subunit K
MENDVSKDSAASELRGKLIFFAIFIVALFLMVLVFF